MKKIILSLLLVIPLFASAADEIILTASGSGSTEDVAVKDALRNAIEQAYGAFISSNTQILNNKLVKDEIVSLSQGVVKSYNIESSAFIKESKTYFVTLKTVVSLNTMASFVNTKTKSSVKVNMGVFDANIKLAELNKKAEKKIMDNLVDFIATVPHLWSYRMELGEPFVSDMYEGMYQINGYVYVLKNENTKQVLNLIKNTILTLSLSEKERMDYEKWGLNYYIVRSKSFSQHDIYLRNHHLPFTGYYSVIEQRDNPSKFANDILLLYAFFGFTISDNLRNPTRYYFTDLFNAEEASTEEDMDELTSYRFLKFKDTPKITDYKYKRPKFDLEKAKAQVSHIYRNTHAMFNDGPDEEPVRCIPIRIYVPQSEASNYTGFEIKEKKIAIKDVGKFHDELPDGISVYDGVSYDQIELPNGKWKTRK